MPECQFPGCRNKAVANFKDNYYCGLHYNIMQRDFCIQKGCKHPIPSIEGIRQAWDSGRNETLGLVP